MSDMFAKTTVAAQRKDLLRQVVFNRPGGIPADQKLLFSAEIGLTVHAFMAEFYAAALQEIDPVAADKVAERLAGYLDDGALPEYAWDRAEAVLLREVDRLRAELVRLRAVVHAVETVECWTNEDGRRFVFAEDLAFALGYKPTTPAAPTV